MGTRNKNNRLKQYVTKEQNSDKKNKKKKFMKPPENEQNPIIQIPIIKSSPSNPSFINRLKTHINSIKMRISRVNTLAAYLFLLLTISIPLVLYNKVTKSKAVHTYVHNLQDKCRIPSFKKYMQTVKYNLVDQFMTVF